MADFKPSFPYNVPVHVLAVKDSTRVKGVLVNTYAEPSKDNLIFCSFKTYGGTEVTSNGVVSIEDTAIIETWYRPDIKANCRVCMADQPEEVYEIIGTPENINKRNQFLKFKVQRVAGGA